MLPVYVHAEWQVEEIYLDRGDGLRTWWEIRRGDDVQHFSSRVKAEDHLLGHGLTLRQFTETDSVNDGCE